jgi:hypothetical protein
MTTLTPENEKLTLVDSSWTIPELNGNVNVTDCPAVKDPENGGVTVTVVLVAAVTVVPGAITPPGVRVIPTEIPCAPDPDPNVSLVEVAEVVTDVGVRASET